MEKWDVLTIAVIATFVALVVNTQGQAAIGETIEPGCPEGKNINDTWQVAGCRFCRCDPNNHSTCFKCEDVVAEPEHIKKGDPTKGYPDCCDSLLPDVGNSNCSGTAVPSNQNEIDT